MDGPTDTFLLFISSGRGCAGHSNGLDESNKIRLNPNKTEVLFEDGFLVQRSGTQTVLEVVVLSLKETGNIPTSIVTTEGTGVPVVWTAGGTTVTLSWMEIA